MGAREAGDEVQRSAGYTRSSVKLVLMNQRRASLVSVLFTNSKGARLIKGVSPPRGAP